MAEMPLLTGLPPAPPSVLPAATAPNSVRFWAKAGVVIALISRKDARMRMKSSICRLTRGGASRNEGIYLRTPRKSPEPAGFQRASGRRNDLPGANIQQLGMCHAGSNHHRGAFY